MCNWFILKFQKKKLEMTRKTRRTIELLDELLVNCASPEEILGKNGLLKQLTKGLVERALARLQGAAQGLALLAWNIIRR